MEPVFLPDGTVMNVDNTTVYYVNCVACGEGAAAGETFHHPHDAATQAVAVGYKVVDGDVYCPECLKGA